MFQSHPPHPSNSLRHPEVLICECRPDVYTSSELVSPRSTSPRLSATSGFIGHRRRRLRLFLLAERLLGSVWRRGAETLSESHALVLEQIRLQRRGFSFFAGGGGFGCDNIMFSQLEAPHLHSYLFSDSFFEHFTFLRPIICPTSSEVSTLMTTFLLSRLYLFFFMWTSLASLFFFDYLCPTINLLFIIYSMMCPFY